MLKQMSNMPILARVYIIAKDEMPEAVKEEVKRYCGLAFGKAVGRWRVLVGGGYAYNYKQDRFQPIRFEGSINEKHLAGYKALRISDLGVGNKENLLQNPSITVAVFRQIINHQTIKPEAYFLQRENQPFK